MEIFPFLEHLGSGWGMHVNPWLIHVNVWQKPLQYCKLISLQLMKINEKKLKLKKKEHLGYENEISELQIKDFQSSIVKWETHVIK